MLNVAYRFINAMLEETMHYTKFKFLFSLWLWLWLWQERRELYRYHDLAGFRHQTKICAGLWNGVDYVFASFGTGSSSGRKGEDSFFITTSLVFAIGKMSWNISSWSTLTVADWDKILIMVFKLVLVRILVICARRSASSPSIATE